MGKKKPGNLEIKKPGPLLEIAPPVPDDKELARLEELKFNKSRLLKSCELNDKAFKKLETIATGEGRDVYKVQHTHTDLVLCRKVVHYDSKPDTLLTLNRELSLLDECHSPYVVCFYGSFTSNNEVNIIMEYMNGGCLNSVLKRVGRVSDEQILARLTQKIIMGLLYLSSNHMLHRDMKPANVLINTNGDVKLCDFGVSRKLLSNRAKTFIGTMRYMSPERIQGKEYNVGSDIWSLGITLIELATGFYPYPGSHAPTSLHPVKDPKNPEAGVAGKKEKGRATPELAIFDMVALVVKGPTPSLPDAGNFSEPFKDFVAKCLAKVPEERATLEELLQHPWITQCPALDLAEWVKSTLPDEMLDEGMEESFEAVSKCRFGE